MSSSTLNEKKLSREIKIYLRYGVAVLAVAIALNEITVVSLFTSITAVANL